MIDYESLYAKFAKFELAKKENGGKTAGLMNPYTSLKNTFVSELTKELTKFKLIRNEDGLISTLKTFELEPDMNLKKAARIACEFNRSNLLRCAGAKNPEYASLTPLLMYAHKKYEGVPYEDWDKADDFFVAACGKDLYKILEVPRLEDVWKQATAENVAVWREESLGDRKVTSHMFKKFYVNIGDVDVPMGYTNSASHMILQTWLAHSTLRVPGAMILNPVNWDDIPETYDISSPSELAVKKENRVKDIPW